MHFSNPTLTWSGNNPQTIQATVFAKEGKTILYSSDTVVSVDANGVVTPNLDAEWIKKILETYPHKGSISATLTAATGDGTMKDTCQVVITLKVDDKTTSGGGGGGGGGGSSGGGGGGSSSGVTPGGTKTSTATLPSYVVTGTWVQNAAGKWLFTGNGRTYSNEWAAVHNPYADVKAGQQAYDWFFFDADGFMMTGWYTDTNGNVFYLNPISDNTLGRMVMTTVYRGRYTLISVILI